MKKNWMVNGFFISVIGFALMMACLEMEPAALDFISRFGLSSYYEGIGLGAAVSVIGLIVLIVGALSPSPKNSTPPAGIQEHTKPSAISDVLVICPKCKARVSSKAKFCPECGEHLWPDMDKPS